MIAAPLSSARRPVSPWVSLGDAAANALAAITRARQPPAAAAPPSQIRKTPAMAQIVVSNPRRLNKNSLIGTGDVELPSGLILRAVMLHGNATKRWILLSAKEWVGADGKRNFSPLVEFATPEIAARFKSHVQPLLESALGLAPLAAGDDQ